MLNRRRFVCGVFSFSAFGLGLSAKSNAAQRGALPSLHGRLSRDVFLALRQQTFTAIIDHRRVPLVLAKVTDDVRGPEGEQFTVVFQAPRGLGLEDAVCVLTHPEAGTTRLYLQPGGVEAHASYYRATFNLLS